MGVPLDSVTWTASAWQTESTFHQLSPYIGKTKSSMAAPLVTHYTKPGDIICDPFCGSGTFAFEGWLAGRRIIANDLSPYAALLTRAKLFPYRSLGDAEADFCTMASLVNLRLQDSKPDLRHVPAWIREFFHPETLREVLMWVDVLKSGRRWFMLACLMGILHHQRPGFLSYPSSHTVPYLRVKKFPRGKFPKLYQYRSVADRLKAKIERAFRRVPAMDYDLTRECHSKRAEKLRLSSPVDAIVTSPPYMRQLDYGRDNRLRLWFLGCKDWDALDAAISPKEKPFLTIMDQCFRLWTSTLRQDGHCVLVIGDTCSRERYKNLPEQVARIATESHGFKLVSTHTDQIPNERRVRRGITGSSSETILVLQCKAAEGKRRA